MRLANHHVGEKCDIAERLSPQFLDFSLKSRPFAYTPGKSQSSRKYPQPVWTFRHYRILKLVVCILLRVLGQVQGFRLTQHWFEYFI
jgi:hypothetical protein